MLNSTHGLTNDLELNQMNRSAQTDSTYLCFRGGSLAKKLYGGSTNISQKIFSF